MFLSLCYNLKSDVQWVEQTYPKGGKDGQVHVLIEKCIKKFKVSCVCGPIAN